MSTDSQTMIKYAVAGIGAIALAGLAYYLSQDDSQPLDYEKFNAKKLE